MIKQKVQDWKSGIRNYIQLEKRQSLHPVYAETCTILEKLKMAVVLNAIETAPKIFGMGVAIGEGENGES